MAIPRKLTIIFLLFYLAIIIYIVLFLFVPDIQETIMKSRYELARIIEGSNYIWALLISLGICILGSASVGFPVPFPFVLFSLSNSIYLKYARLGLTIEEILLNGPFWLETFGIAIVGGLGCALGELTGFLVGRGAKKIVEKSDKASRTLKNVEGFGKLILERPSRMYLYIFIAAALPIPDDPLWIALGMSNKPFKIYKFLFWGWMGKNITTIFYVLLPILILLGVTASGMEIKDVSSVVTEAIMLLTTLTIMYIILSFDWNKYLKNKKILSDNKDKKAGLS